MQEAFDRYKDEMADLSETVEIGLLDKEMAEERVSMETITESPMINWEFH